MIKQDWMVIVAGEKLVDDMSAEQKTRVAHNGMGYESEALCRLQRERASKGIEGVEIVKSMYGFSVRYDSGLQNFELLMPSRGGDGTLATAEAFVKAWVAQKPECRYGWYRKAREVV